MTPLFTSLHSAARLIVIQEGYGTNWTIDEDRWATTYRTDVETVRDALKLAENGKRKLPEEIAATTPPAITYDGEGK